MEFGAHHYGSQLPHNVISKLTISRQSTRAGNATIILRIEEIHRALGRHRVEQQALVTALETQETLSREQAQELGQITKRLDSHESSSITILGQVKQAFGAIVQVQWMLGNVADRVVRLHDMLASSTYMRGLDPTKNLPVVFEDALGFQRELPMDWLEDWEVRTQDP